MTAWVGVLIVFLHLQRTSSAFAGEQLPPECAALARDRRLLMIVVGLMAGWFLIQYVGLLLI